MNYKDFVKKFEFPESFMAPKELIFEDLKAQPFPPDLGARPGVLATLTPKLLTFEPKYTCILTGVY